MKDQCISSLFWISTEYKSFPPELLFIVYTQFQYGSQQVTVEGHRRKYWPSSLTYITQTRLTSDCKDRRIKKVDLLCKHFLLHWYGWWGRNNERPRWWKALLATKVKLVTMRKGGNYSFCLQQNTAEKSITVLHSLTAQDCKDPSLRVQGMLM